MFDSFTYNLKFALQFLFSKLKVYQVISIKISAHAQYLNLLPLQYNFLQSTHTTDNFADRL